MEKEITLYLIPTVLAADTVPETLPVGVVAVIERLNVFFVENVRTARRFISRLKLGKPIDEIRFFELNKDTLVAETRQQIAELSEDAGILSEAGVPCVADPGNTAVEIAHEFGFKVRPLTGPSSILLALMGSGFSGQSFAFRGYLPVEKSERVKAILQMEKLASQTGQTQIFMETPYRNNQLLENLLTSCQQSTRLCVAADLTGADEFIQTKAVREWKKNAPNLNRRPAIFILGN